MKTAKECGLPQSRSRVWVFAVRSSVLKELDIAPGAVRNFLKCKICPRTNSSLSDFLNPDPNLRKERNDIGTSIMRSPRRNTNSTIYAVRSNML